MAASGNIEYNQQDDDREASRINKIISKLNLLSSDLFGTIKDIMSTKSSIEMADDEQPKSLPMKKGGKLRYTWF